MPDEFLRKHLPGRRALDEFETQRNSQCPNDNLCFSSAHCDLSSIFLLPFFPPKITVPVRPPPLKNKKVMECTEDYSTRHLDGSHKRMRFEDSSSEQLISPSNDLMFSGWHPDLDPSSMTVAAAPQEFFQQVRPRSHPFIAFLLFFLKILIHTLAFSSSHPLIGVFLLNFDCSPAQLAFAEPSPLPKYEEEPDQRPTDGSGIVAPVFKKCDKGRLVWTDDLHERFLQAVDQLGVEGMHFHFFFFFLFQLFNYLIGSLFLRPLTNKPSSECSHERNTTTPKFQPNHLIWFCFFIANYSSIHAAAKPQTILQFMNVDGLTAEHIKSHLQVRLYKNRFSHTLFPWLELHGLLMFLLLLLPLND
jgi:hypothetical protein